jgi:hypothetical protein
MMKSSLQCPGCSGNRILHVREVADRTSDESERVGKADAPHVQAISAAWRIARVREEYRALGIPAVRESVAGLVEAYVCKRCGLTELYTLEPEKLPVDGVYVKELVGPGVEPYR